MGPVFVSVPSLHGEGVWGVGRGAQLLWVFYIKNTYYSFWVKTGIYNLIPYN